MLTKILCVIMLTAQISAVNANLSLADDIDWIGINSMAESIITRKAFRYRIYPSKAQQTLLKQTLSHCCELYNAALQERRDAWQIARKSINYRQQQNDLPEIKAVRPEFNQIHSQVLQDVLRRLDKAFDAFFRRVKAGDKKAGFPRFRSHRRYDSITYAQSGFAVEKDRLRLSKIGKVKIKPHRPIEGKIKTLTIARSATGKWYACFSVEIESQPVAHTTDAVGIDVGLAQFATLSTGEAVANPKFFRSDEKRLAKAQSKRDKAPKRSLERERRNRVVSRIHERIANRRKDFAHQTSRRLVNRFALIVFEDLNIQGMLKNHCLAKSISDAAWNQLVQFTTYKAVEAGSRAVQVNPRNTSKMCSGCGELVEKDLSVRIHNCSGCGLTLDRDHNAAINILALGLQRFVAIDIEAASF